MLGLFRIRWRDISISKKLYLVVGVMAILIAGELLALRFAMRTLSAARAFVHGEGLWSKSQKDAILFLQRYARTKDEADFQAFEKHLEIPEGDHVARIELLKPVPDLDIIRNGFIQGGVHPDDIDPMLDLLRNFSNVSYISRAVSFWAAGDEKLAEMKVMASSYRQAVRAGDESRLGEIFGKIHALNQELRVLEDGFSSALGEGSRWLEKTVLTLLLFAVLGVETIGLSLAFFTSRAISEGLHQLVESADRIGKGQFDAPIPVLSNDEIGLLGEALNRMRILLQANYSTLEARVAERTLELENLAKENERLYGEAKKALEYRDEFLSVASHELKTPLTAIHLQLQIFDRLLQTTPEDDFVVKSKQIMGSTIGRSRRLKRLLDELLDLTRLRLGKLEIKHEDCDLSGVVREALAQVTPESSEKRSIVRVETPPRLDVTVDPIRVAQVVTNLVSNAIKYGEGKPVDVVLEETEASVSLSVRDNGIGIEESKRNAIFERFERAAENPNITGLGLGLYIAKHIVEAHSGEISVTSSIGRGSTFCVTFPKKPSRSPSRVADTSSSVSPVISLTT